MATFLDISLLYHVRIIFVVLFIGALIYAVLTKTSVLGGNKTVAIWIAVSMSFFFAFSAKAGEFLDAVIPSFVIFLIGIFVLLVAFVFIGGDASKISTMFSAQNPAMMGYWVFIITLLILVGGLGKVYFDPNSSTDTQIEGNYTGDAVIQVESSTDGVGGQGEDALWDTIFHPQVLGFILLMLVATFSVMFLTKA